MVTSAAPIESTSRVSSAPLPQGGALYLSIEGIGLVRYDGKAAVTLVKWQDVVPLDPRPQSATAIFVSGAVYFQAGEIYRYEDGRASNVFGAFDPHRDDNKRPCGDLIQAPTGEIYVPTNLMKGTGARGKCNRVERVDAPQPTLLAILPDPTDLGLEHFAMDRRGRIWKEGDRKVHRLENNQWKPSTLGFDAFDWFAPIGDGIMTGGLGQGLAVDGDEGLGAFSLAEFDYILRSTADGRSPIVVVIPDLDGSDRGPLVIRKLIPVATRDERWEEWHVEAPLPEVVVRPSDETRVTALHVDARHRVWVSTGKSLGVVDGRGKPIKQWADARAAFGGAVLAVATSGLGPELAP